MRLALTVGLLASLSCTAGPRSVQEAGSARGARELAPVPLGFSLRAGERLVYRRVGGADAELHWVERAPDGALVLGVDDAALREAGRDEMPADLVFPLPGRPVGREPLRVRREVVVNGLRLLVTEELRIAAASAREATVRFRRSTALADVTGSSPPAPLTEQTGEATFDRTNGRYSRISFDERRADAFGGGSGSAEWVYDDSLSRQRIAARRDAAPTSDGGDADPTAEIAAVIDALADPAAPVDALGFHVHSHPLELWRGVIDRPRAGERFVAARPVIDDLRRGPSEEVVALIRSRWADAAFAHALIARIADERFRPELRQLADASAPTRVEARLTLQALDLASHALADRWRPLVRFPSRLREVWRRLSGSPSRDPSPLVPLLLELASGPGAPLAVRDVFLDVVRRAGFPGSDADRRVWRRWWSSEAGKPWGDRLVEAFRSAPPERRGDALALLADGPDTMAAREALAEALEGGSLRLEAAAALARWKDRRAAPVLVAALADPSTSRDALEALGYLADTTLGFDPPAAAGPERTAALARWRAWLDRAGQ